METKKMEREIGSWSHKGYVKQGSKEISTKTRHIGSWRRDILSITAPLPLMVLRGSFHQQKLFSYPNSIQDPPFTLKYEYLVPNSGYWGVY